MGTAKRRQAYPLQPVVNAVGAAILVMVPILLFGKAGTFYLMPVSDRVEHPLFRTLRPSGFIGHGLGIIGTAIILTNLLYLARRRFQNLPLGSMRAWLDMHVFTGLLGSELVLFHSAFQLRNGVATASAASLAIVVVTGIIGRFLYAMSPRPDTAGLEAALRDLDARLPGMGQRVKALLDNSRPKPPGEVTLMEWFGSLPHWWSMARARRQEVVLAVGISPAFARLPARDQRGARRLGRAVGQAAYKEVRSMAATGFLRSWRSLHRFFAILMVLAVVVHIGVAWYFGYRWIFE